MALALALSTPSFPAFKELEVQPGTSLCLSPTYVAFCIVLGHLNAHLFLIFFQGYPRFTRTLLSEKNINALELS